MPAATKMKTPKVIFNAPAPYCLGNMARQYGYSVKVNPYVNPPWSPGDALMFERGWNGDPLDGSQVTVELSKGITEGQKRLHGASQRFEGGK